MYSGYCADGYDMGHIGSLSTCQSSCFSTYSKLVVSYNFADGHCYCGSNNNECATFVSNSSYTVYSNLMSVSIIKYI